VSTLKGVMLNLYINFGSYRSDFMSTLHETCIYRFSLFSDTVNFFKELLKVKMKVKLSQCP